MKALVRSGDLVKSRLLEKTYRSVLPELNALRPEELLPVNLEIMAAMTTARGVVPRLRTMYERVRALPEFDFAKFERLEAYALAVGFAHAEHLHAEHRLRATYPLAELGALREEGARFRRLFFLETKLLIERGLVNEESLNDVRRGSGYKVLMTDLQILLGILKENWRHLGGKSGTTPEDLERAGLVVERLSYFIGLREQSPEVIARTAEMRRRAFTLFTKTYDQARRAMTYLRWGEDDVDSFLPSLYRGHGGRKRDPTIPKPTIPTP